MVDLAKVTVIDSTGVRLLPLMAERRNGRLGLILRPQVARVVEIAGMRASVLVLEE